MNTETVFKIIDMLDARIDHIKLIQPEPTLKDWYNGLAHGLEELREHLQEYIELEVSKAENDLAGGE